MIALPKSFKQLQDVLIFAIIILAVVGVGLFAVNQGLKYYYNSAFLQTPCQLCQELNPEVRECFNTERQSQDASEMLDLNITIIGGNLTW